jgi:Rrf2 family protein
MKLKNALPSLFQTLAQLNFFLSFLACAYARTRDSILQVIKTTGGKNMKATKTLVYALACIQELAAASRTRQVSEIAEACKIPGAYCQKVLFLLAKAGILSSVKGQGFSLIQEPQEISALRVFEALEETSERTWGEEHGSMLRLQQKFSSKLNETLSSLKVSELFAQPK